MKKKIILLAIAAVLIISMGGVLAGCNPPAPKPTLVPSLQELYYYAVNDAMTIEANEIAEYLTLTEGSKGVVFNETKEKVLMYTLHKYPESYIDNTTVELKYGHVWTVNSGEMENWYREYEDKATITDWQIRLSQLLGVAYDSNYTHITAMWVNVSDCWRPAFNSDVLSDVIEDSVKGDAEYKEWFKENVYNSYFGALYPWTRLGYTYDWGAYSREFGLHEFLVRKGKSVDIKFTKTVAEFMTYLNAL